MRKPKPVFRCGQTPRFWGLLAAHRVLTGPAVEADKYAQRQVVHARRAEGQAHLLVRATADDPVSLEELALDYPA